ncbi:MAG TPA: alpha-hydroxy acid oxidase [Stellaceae bacterium]|nr:alpha-hydroxy acid oxidase [Stellaceae bacterium]
MAEVTAKDVSARDEGEFLNLHEFVKAARMKLSSNVWDYLTGGAETETTLRRNRLALESLAFRPRVLRDVSHVDPAGTLFGKKLRIPVMLAPVGSIEVFDEGGAGAAAKAAQLFGAGCFVSSVSQPGLEATAAAAPGGRTIFQLYVRGDRNWVDDHVRRAIAAGYEAFCLTIDTAIYGRRERDLGKRYRPRGRRAAAGHGFQAALNWDEVKRLKDKFQIPLVLKGIATAEDAETALGYGVDGIYISNHGGRQLDHGRGAIEVLPEVAAAVKGRAQIIIDGGFCRGTDVIKALALGANAVSMGRMYCYALTAAGADGVVRALELLENEMMTAMGLLGINRTTELDKSYVHAAAPVREPHVLSAFPLLNLADDGYSGR